MIGERETTGDRPLLGRKEAYCKVSALSAPPGCSKG